MKHIQVIAYCDSEHHVERVRAQRERTVSVDGCDPVQLDLCESCDHIFVQLAELMERGIPDEQAKPVPKKKVRKSRDPNSGYLSTCPDCLHHSPNRAALGQHARSAHQKGLKMWSEAEFEAADRKRLEQVGAA